MMALAISNFILSILFVIKATSTFYYLCVSFIPAKKSATCPPSTSIISIFLSFIYINSYTTLWLNQISIHRIFASLQIPIYKYVIFLYSHSQFPLKNGHLLPSTSAAHLHYILTQNPPQLTNLKTRYLPSLLNSSHDHL